MEDIPRVNELNESESKFIQIYINNEPYLRYASKEQNYHSTLLRAILTEFNIKFKTQMDRSLGEIPLKEDKELNYALVGAGKVSYVSREVMKFYDSSGSYSVGTNLKHLEDVFKDKKVKITKAEGRFIYFVDFNNKTEKKNGERSEEIILKSNFKNDSDEVPF